MAGADRISITLTRDDWNLVMFVLGFWAGSAMGAVGGNGVRAERLANRIMAVMEGGE